MEWVDYCYGRDYVERVFDEKKIPDATTDMNVVQEEYRQVIKDVQKNADKIVNEKDKENIQQVGKIQRNIKNYIWKRYGGISGLLKHSGWTIRDEIKEQNLYSKKIPQTLSKVAVEKGSGTIKTNWKNIRKDVKQAIMKNENLKEEDRIYLFTCLKHTPTLYAILNYKKVDFIYIYMIP